MLVTSDSVVGIFCLVLRMIALFTPSPTPIALFTPSQTEDLLSVGLRLGIHWKLCVDVGAYIYPH